MYAQRTDLFPVVMAIALAGCDPAASNGYEGNVLATLQGVVVGGPQAPPIPLEVALVWGRPDGNGMKFIAEKVPLTGSFPAEFTVPIHHPPPGRAGWQLPSGRLNVAFIAALDKNDWVEGTLLEQGRDVLAYGLAHEMLVHLDRDLPAGQGILGLGGVRTAGFHLIERATVGADEARKQAEACRQTFPTAPPDACEPAPAVGGGFHIMREARDGLSHKISMELEFPDFTVISGGEDDPGPPCPDCGDLTPSGDAGAMPVPGGGSNGGGGTGQASGSFTSGGS